MTFPHSLPRMPDDDAPTRAEADREAAEDERRARIDQLAGPRYPSDDFEGATTGAPDLAYRRGYTPAQIEAIHDQACEHAECYVSPETALAIHEREGR